MKKNQFVLFLTLLAGFGYRADGGNIANTQAKRREIDAELRGLHEKAEKEGLVPEIAAKVKELEDLDENLGRFQDSLEKRASLLKLPEDQRFSAEFQLSNSEDRDLGKFSLSKFLDAAINNKPLSGIEAEVATIGANAAQEAKVSISGSALPPVIIAHMARRFRADMTATGGSGGNQGGTLIQTSLAGPLGPLYERSVCAALGATQLSNLSGYLDIPTYGDTTPQTVKAENADADEVSSATGLINLRPRRLPVVMDISKMLTMLTNSSVDAMLLNHLLTRFGLKVDNYALNGSGSSNQPYGVFNTTGVTAIGSDTNGAALTWASTVAFTTAVANGNAAVGNLGWAINPSVEGKLATTEKFANTGKTIIDENNRIRGYGYQSTTAITSTATKGTSSGVCSHVAFGNWADLIMASWGGLDVEPVNDRANAIAGLKSLVVTGFFDSVVQRAASFAIKKDVLTA